MDYSTLVAGKSVSGSIRNWLNNDLLPADDVLDDAESWLYRRLRVRQMLLAATGTLAAAASTITLPSDFIWPNQLVFTGQNHAVLKYEVLPNLVGRFIYDSTDALVTAKPSHFAIDATNIVLNSKADKAYTYRFDYFAQPAALSSANETNFLTSRGTRLLRLTCVAFANEWLKDENERQYWLALAMAEVEQWNRESEMAEIHNSHLQIVLE